MKHLLLKIPAVLGMLIGLTSFYYYALYLADSPIEDTWIVSALLAMFSVPFFLVDAIISFVKAIKNIDSKFNYILALVLVGAIPMVVIFGGDGKDFFNVIWNVYYVLVFVLEFISIKKAFSLMKAKRNEVK